MAHFDEPYCQQYDPEDIRSGICNIKMRALGERHPSFGPNFRAGGWVFECPRCHSIRFIESDKLEQFLTRK